MKSYFVPFVQTSLLSTPLLKQSLSLALFPSFQGQEALTPKLGLFRSLSLSFPNPRTRLYPGREQGAGSKGEEELWLLMLIGNRARFSQYKADVVLFPSNTRSKLAHGSLNQERNLPWMDTNQASPGAKSWLHVPLRPLH